jgi:hypothetical protein
MLKGDKRRFPLLTINLTIRRALAEGGRTVRTWCQLSSQKVNFALKSESGVGATPLSRYVTPLSVSVNWCSKAVGDGSRRKLGVSTSVSKRLGVRQQAINTLMSKVCNPHLDEPNKALLSPLSSPQPIRQALCQARRRPAAGGSPRRPAGRLSARPSVSGKLREQGSRAARAGGRLCAPRCRATC